jgi:hypothetical protein
MGSIELRKKANSARLERYAFKRRGRKRTTNGLRSVVVQPSAGHSHSNRKGNKGTGTPFKKGKLTISPKIAYNSRVRGRKLTTKEVSQR